MLIGASFSIPVTSHDLFGLVWTCLERHRIPQAGIVIHPNSAPPACQRLVKGQEELRKKKWIPNPATWTKTPSTCSGLSRRTPPWPLRRSLVRLVRSKAISNLRQPQCWIMWPPSGPRWPCRPTGPSCTAVGDEVKRLGAAPEVDIRVDPEVPRPRPPGHLPSPMSKLVEAARVSYQPRPRQAPNQHRMGFTANQITVP